MIGAELGYRYVDSLSCAPFRGAEHRFRVYERDLAGRALAVWLAERKPVQDRHHTTREST